MDKKMDNVNFVPTVSTSFIFDNLDLHAKPMDSSTKNAMDAKRDLGVHRKNGVEQKRTDDIQQISSSVQEKQQNFQQSQWTSRSNGIAGKWDRNQYNNSMGCSLLPVHDQLMLPKDKVEKTSHEIFETSEFTFSASKPDLSMDNNNGKQSQKATIHNQCFLEVETFLEVEPAKDYQPCIWCINYSSRPGRQERIVQIPAKQRPIHSSSGSTWKRNSKPSRLGVRELLGNECLDLFMPSGTGSPNRVSNNISTQRTNNGTMRKLQSYSELVVALKNDRKFREFCITKDEWLIDQENREYFDKIYGITYIHPLLVDHSGVVFLFLDNRGIMFKWCEMTQDMYILGINKMEGLANYLYHPEKICAVMKDTGELVPEVELTRRVMEKMAKAKPLEVIK